MTEDSFISLQKLNYFLKDFPRNKFFLQKFLSNYGDECGLIEDIMLTAAAKWLVNSHID